MSTYERYYEVIRRVPHGRVTTYGTVAREAGVDGGARQVGYALAALPGTADLPWHRVVNARGEVARRSGGRTFEHIQRALLKAEGVEFSDLGRVDLDHYGWP